MPPLPLFLFPSLPLEEVVAGATPSRRAVPLENKEGRKGHKIWNEPGFFDGIGLRWPGPGANGWREGLNGDGTYRRPTERELELIERDIAARREYMGIPLLLNLRTHYPNWTQSFESSHRGFKVSSLKLSSAFPDPLLK